MGSPVDFLCALKAEDLNVREGCLAEKRGFGSAIYLRVQYTVVRMFITLG